MLWSHNRFLWYCNTVFGSQTWCHANRLCIGAGSLWNISESNSWWIHMHALCWVLFRMATSMWPGQHGRQSLTSDTSSLKAAHCWTAMVNYNDLYHHFLIYKQTCHKKKGDLTCWLHLQGLPRDALCEGLPQMWCDRTSCATYCPTMIYYVNRWYYTVYTYVFLKLCCGVEKDNSDVPNLLKYFDMSLHFVCVAFTDFAERASR